MISKLVKKTKKLFSNYGWETGCTITLFSIIAIFYQLGKNIQKFNSNFKLELIGMILFLLSVFLITVLFVYQKK
jgi:hypothetical protein